MKKTNNHYKNHTSLSAHESTLLNAVEPLLLFSHRDVKKITGWPHQRISNALTSLKKKNILAAPKKDNYIVIKKIPENLYTLSTSLHPPSYLSFWSACSYYGFTEQQPHAIQVVSTKQYPPLTLQKHRIEIITVSPSRFFGYQKRNNIPIAEPEKLFLDCLAHPAKVGGITELLKCLTSAWPNINLTQLKAYLLQYHNKALFARLGYLLETSIPKKQQSQALQQFLWKHLPKSYTLLNPSKKSKQTYNTTWRININDK